MDNPHIRRWARDLELLNHLALFDLGLVVEPEVAASCFCGHHLRGVAVEDRLAAVVACRRSRTGGSSTRAPS